MHPPCRHLLAHKPTRLLVSTSVTFSPPHSDSLLPTLLLSQDMDSVPLVGTSADEMELGMASGGMRKDLPPEWLGREGDVM